MELGKIPAKYLGLEYLQLPIALVDRHFNLLHYNSTFGKLLIATDQVFPPKDLSSVFIDFAAKIKMESPALTGSENFTVAGLTHADSQRIYDLHLSRILPDLDHIHGFTVSCMDVTERNRLLQSELELSDHHKRFLEYTNTGVIIHRNGKILYANRQAELIMDMHAPDTLVGRDIWNFVSKEFIEIVADRIKKLNEHSPSVAPIEEKLIKPNGSVVDVEVFAYPVTYKGEFAIKTIITDISFRKLAEQKLLASRQQYYTLVENLTDVVFQADVDARFWFLNASWEKLTGFTQEETLGKSCFDFLQHPHNTDLFHQKVRKLLMYGVQEFQYDLLLRTKSGLQKFVEVSLKPIFNDHSVIVGINGIIRDIHAKKIADLEVKRIQKTLKHQQNVLVSLTHEESIITGNLDAALQKIAAATADTLQVSRVLIKKINADGEQLECVVNYDHFTHEFISAQSVLAGQFPMYVKTLKHQRMLIADDAASDPRMEEFRDIYIQPEQVISMMEIAILKGDKIWGVLSCENRFSYHKWTLEDQSFARSVADFVLLAVESSTLLATQKALVEKQALYSSLVAQATDAIIILDNRDNFIEFNDALCELSGFTRDELMRMNLSDLVPERFFKQRSKKNKPVRKELRFFGERIFKIKNGEERFFEISAVSFPDGRLQGIARDITERKKQEQALIDSEARLELALKGADLGTWDFYIEEDRMVHNRRWAEMLGYYFENTAVTKHFWEKFVHPDDVALSNYEFQRHLDGETPFYEASIRMLASNGEWRWILDKGKVVEWDKNGKPYRASGIHQDITELKLYQQQLLQHRKFLQELVNSIPSLIYVRNSNEEFVTVNNALTEFLGTTSDELLGYRYNHNRSFAGALTKLCDKDYDVFLLHKPVLIDNLEIKNSSTGKSHWFQTIKIPLVNESGVFSEVLSVSTDITEIKQKENELSVLNDNLELKVSERTALLESANKELETFNYSVSHDLRTPLRSIDIFAYFLDKNYKDKLDKDGLENIRQIRRSILKMSALIDNLLIFSKIGRSDKKADIIQTKDLVEDVIHEMQEQLEPNYYQFIVGELPAITGDYSMIRQAFVNLLSNAVKFTQIRPKPVIEINGIADTHSATISIHDNGVGFSMEFKDKLFKAFKRLHSDERFEGTGVGLAIVERIIKRHNGTVWAESEEDKGTTFWFSIPQ